MVSPYSHFRDKMVLGSVQVFHVTFNPSTVTVNGHTHKVFSYLPQTGVSRVVFVSYSLCCLSRLPSASVCDNE